MKNTIFIFSLAFLLGIISFASCNNNSETEEAIKELEEAGEAVGDVFRTEKEELEHDLKDLRQAIDERVRELEADLENASAESRQSINRQINELKKESKKIDRKLEDLGDQLAESWYEFKEDTKKTIRKVRWELDSAL